MKNFFRITCFFFLFLVLIGSCSKEKSLTDSQNTNILGKWNWIKSVYPYGNHIITPQSEGYSTSLLFNANNTVERYISDTLASILPFSFRYRKNDPQNPSSDSTKLLVIGTSESYFDLKSDTLIFEDGYVDGPNSYYIKVK